MQRVVAIMSGIITENVPNPFVKRPVSGEKCRGDMRKVYPTKGCGGLGTSGNGMQCATKGRVICAAILLMMLVTLAGCELENNEQSPQSEGVGDEWVAEELLKQVQALRKENATMREQLTTLTEKIEALEEKNVQVARKDQRRRDKAPESVRFDAERTRGDSSAEVAIVEFTDFECPFCGRHHERVYPDIEKNMIKTGQIRYATMDYPLPFHANAEGAAIAANCAGEQGKYWQMHHALFENQKGLNRDLYVAQAEELGMNMDRFRACLDDDAQRKAVNASVVYGQKMGVTGTPKFFVGRIDGERIVDVAPISGAQSYGVFEAAVDRLLN